MPRPSPLRLSWALAALASTGCLRDECEALTRCLSESQYEWCNTGSDWEAHRHVIDCEAPHRACVQEDPEHARCVYAPATRCDASFTDRCEGSWRVYCDTRLGWVQAVDCHALGSPGCQVDAALGKAVCD
jgi:hypothetical protein